MKPRPGRVPNKPRFAVDINVSTNELKKKFGQFATFTSTFKLTKSQESTDPEIIKVCNSLNYHVITRNTKDFEELPQNFPNLKIGIVCVNLQERNYMDKLGSLLRGLKKHQRFYNKLIVLGNEIKIVNYSDLRNSTG